MFRFFFGLLYRDRIALGDPHPGNYLLRPDGRVGFLDFGLVRDVDAHRVQAERAIALAVRDQDAPGLRAGLIDGGYLPAERSDAVDAEFALRLVRRATRWYAVPGERRFKSGGQREHRGRDRHDADGSGRPDGAQRDAIKGQVRQFTVPPESILIRRMHGVVATVLHQLRAGADWGAVAGEYLHGAAPATVLGEAETDFFARRGR